MDSWCGHVNILSHAACFVMKEQRIKGTLTKLPTCNCGTEENAEYSVKAPDHPRRNRKVFLWWLFNGLLGKGSCAQTIKVSLKISCNKWVHLWLLHYLSHYGPLGNIVFIVNKLFYLFMYVFFVFIPQGQLEWHREGEREWWGWNAATGPGWNPNLAAVIRTQHWYYKKLF